MKLQCLSLFTHSIAIFCAAASLLVIWCRRCLPFLRSTYHVVLRCYWNMMTGFNDQINLINHGIFFLARVLRTEDELAGIDNRVGGIEGQHYTTSPWIISVKQKVFSESTAKFASLPRSVSPTERRLQTRGKRAKSRQLHRKSYQMFFQRKKTFEVSAVLARRLRFPPTELRRTPHIFIPGTPDETCTNTTALVQ